MLNFSKKIVIQKSHELPLIELIVLSKKKLADKLSLIRLDNGLPYGKFLCENGNQIVKQNECYPYYHYNFTF